MSQNVPVLSVLVLLFAPYLVWSGEPHFSNIPRIGSSYQGAGTSGIQYQNTRSSSTNLLPVYSVSNHQNAYGSAPETFRDFQSNHRREPHQIPSYAVRPSQAARFMTSLPHGILPPEVDEINPHGMNSVLRASSANQMIPLLDATEQGVPSGTPLSGRGDPLNKIPIYVIRPPYSGMTSPTIVNLAVLPQEQINPEIIRILQSLRLPQDRAPLVLVAGQYPSLTADVQNNADSGINTMDFNDPPGGRHEPVMGMIAPHTLSDEEWYDEEIMKHETLIHGIRPPIFPNIGRFAQVSPQLNAKPGIPPLDYLPPNPEDPQNIVPMNTGRFVVPRGRNLPSGFLPSQLNTLPRMITPQDYYPPAMDQVPTGVSDSQRYQPIPQTGIPDYLTQQPQFSRRFTPNLHQKPGYLGSPYPGQQNLYSGPYNQQTPNNFQIPSSPQFPSSDGRAPSVHDRPEVISQMGRFIIPETPSQYPSIYLENLIDSPHAIPKQFHPGKQTKYPFIHKVPQVRRTHPSYPYPPDTDVPDTPERSYLASKYNYPEFPSRDSEALGNYPDLEPVNPSQSPHFPPHSPPPSGNIHLSLPQYPSINKQLPIQPRPNIHAKIEELTIPDKQQQVPPHSYPQFPPASPNVLDYHSLSPNQYYPDQNPKYPSGRLIPITHPSLHTPSIPTYDDGEPNLLSTPDIYSLIDKINIPDARSYPQIKFPQFDKVVHPALYPDGTTSKQIPSHQPQYSFESQLSDYQVPQEGAQYPLTGTDENTSNVNTLELPSHEQLDLLSDDQLPKYPKHDTDGEPSRSPRPEINSKMEKFIMPENPHPSTQQKYPKFPSENYEGPTTYTAGPQKPHNGSHPDALYDGLITHQPRQPMDDTVPQVEARTEIVSNMEKFSIPERGYPTPLQEYPLFPSADYDEPTKYAGSGPQNQHKETHPDYPNDGQITLYPRQPIDDIEPQVDPRTEVITKAEKFSILEPLLLKPHHQIYAQASSSDTDAPTFYRDSGTGQPFRGIHPDFPNDGQAINYPKQSTEATTPGLKPRNEVVSNMGKFSVPEKMNQIPEQTYPQAPSSDTNEPTYPDSGQRQSFRGTHPDFPYYHLTDYSKHPINDKEPQVRSRPDIFSNIEQFSIPEQSYTMPQQKYGHIPSSYTDEPEYHSQSGSQQPYKETHPDFQFDEQSTGYPEQQMDDTEPLMRPKPDVVSTIEKFRIPNQPVLKPQLRYPLIPSSGTAQPMYYPESSSQQPYRGQHPDFSSSGQDAGYSKKFVDDTESKLKPVPYFNANMEKFHLPEQPHPSLQLKVPTFPSSDRKTNNPEIDLLGRDAVPYPDFPAYSQIPAGFPEQPIDPSEQRMRPRPILVSELKKPNILEVPDIMPQERYPQYPSSHTDDTRKYADRGPNLYTFQKPESLSDGQISDYPKYPYGHEEPKPEKHRPETVSEIKKLNIPEEYHLEPQGGYPRYPSLDIGEPIYQPGSGIQQPYGKYPESDSRIPGYNKGPFENAETTMIPQPETVSEIRKFYIPEDSIAVKKHPQYPSRDRDAPQMFPDQGMQPSFSVEQPGFTSDENAPGQLHQLQPENLPIQPRPDVSLQFERIHITERPPAEKMEEYHQWYPSVGTADEHTGYLGTIPQFQYEPSGQPRPDVITQIGRLMVPKQRYTDQQPHWLYERTVPTDYPDQYSPHYPSSLHKPASMRPITDPQTRKIEDQKSTGSGVEPQYPGMRRPKFDNTHPNHIPKFSTDTSFPTDEAQQVFSQYPPFDEIRIPERPDIVSQVGVLTIPGTPDLRIQQKYPQYLPSDTKFPLPQLNTYPQHGPSDQQQPSPLIQHPVQHSPQQPPINNMGHFLLPRPDFTTQIGRINIPEPGKDPNTFPLQIPDNQIRQLLPDIYTTDIPNQRNAQQPSSDDQLQLPDFSSSDFASTTSPVKPKTSGRGVEPEQHVYPNKDHIYPTLDIIANLERFKTPEVPPFIPPGQGHPQYLPIDGTLLQPETKRFPSLKLRESNDIDINIERVTVLGQMPWKPGQRYPQYAPTDTQKPDEYPETHPLYPNYIPQPQMEPDHHLPIGGENPDQDYSSSSPPKPHQHPPFLYSPKEQPARDYQEYPYTDTDFPSNPIQPRVTVDVEKVTRPDHPNLLPMHGYPQYPSAGDEPPPQFRDYGLQYPPESQVPRDHELLPSTYSFADQGFPKKQQQPDIKMRMERFDVTDPLGSSPVDDQSQHFYTTSTTSTTQQPQYYPSSNHPSQSYPDSPQSQIDMPNNQTKTDISLPIERESPSVASGYPFPTIGISTVVQPHQDQLIHPNLIDPQTYQKDQYPDSLHYPGEAGVPHMRPTSTTPSTWEGYPVDVYSPDSPRQPTIGHPTFHPDGKEPQYYPQDQPPVSLPAEEPNHLRKPTVYVYPVPRQKEIPQSYVPQLERNLSWPAQPEPLSYSPGTHDYQTLINGRTPVYPQPDQYGTSPRVHQLDLQGTLEPPEDFPKDLSRSIQDQPKPHGSTTQSPGTVERHEVDQKTSIKGYVDETSSMPSIQTQHTTSIYSESMPSQSGVSWISTAGTTLHPQLSAEQTVLSSTLTYPVENPPSKTTINHLNPLEPNRFIPSGSVFEGMPDQRLGPQVPHSPQDSLHTELPNGQESGPERVQPVGEPGLSVNTLDFPYSTKGMNEYKPVSSSSTIRPSEEPERGFYPDEALTTTIQSIGVGSTPNEPSIILPTLVPQVVHTREQPEPSSGATDVPTSSSTSIESGSSTLPLDSPHIPEGSSLLPDSKITRIFPVTKPTFYTDKDGQKFVTLKLLNEPISTSATGDIIPRQLTDSPQNPGTTDLVIPIGRDVSDSLPQNTTQPHPMLEGIPISNVQVFDAHTIIKVIESCNCTNLKFLIPILKRPQSAIVVANSEYPGIAN